MKLFLGLVTPDERLRQYFGRGKIAIVPEETFKRGPWSKRQVEVSILAWQPKQPFSARDLERFVLAKAKDHDACLLMVDIVWSHYAQDLGTTAFKMDFDGSALGGSLKNVFFGLSARLFRSFGQVLEKFDNVSDAKLLALPLRNFQAAELAEIARLCRENPLSNTLGNDVETQLTALRKRVRPRKKSEYKTIYAVDDQNRFFVYGHERHSQFDTGEPHSPSCEAAGLFRFGVRLDERRHYNVSETEADITTISGNFPDCHGEVHEVKPRTHLNMFANDFF